MQCTFFGKTCRIESAKSGANTEKEYKKKKIILKRLIAYILVVEKMPLWLSLLEKMERCINQ